MKDNYSYSKRSTNKFLLQVGLFLGGTTLGMLGMHMYQSSSNGNSVHSVVNNAQGHHRLAARAIPQAGAAATQWEGVNIPETVTDILTRQGYITGYNRQTRNPNWVLEHLNKERLVSNADRDDSKFIEDTNVPAQFRALLKDYSKSGYDRGHQAPAGDIKFNQDAMDETFYLTNMCPQVGVGFNRQYWAYFEQFCRNLVGDFTDVYVITGPLYLPKKDAKFPNPDKYYVQYEVIGNPPNVAVPTHFFKVILAKPAKGGAPSLGGFVLPNIAISNDKPLTDFVVPVNEIEKSSGSIFFSEFGADKVSKLPHLCTTTTCKVSKYNNFNSTADN